MDCRAYALLSRQDKLAAALIEKTNPSETLKEYLKKMIIALINEKIDPEYVRLGKAIKECNGNVSRAEKLLGLRKSYINDYCRKRGLNIPK